MADSYDNWTPPVHQKSAEQLERLKRAIQGNFLFSHLDEEQSSQILGALMEKPIPTKGIKVRKDTCTIIHIFVIMLSLAVLLTLPASGYYPG